jgi:uncharacterized protein (DUF1697 family)
VPVAARKPLTRYAALLRGIAPTNPNMRNEKLRECFESLGFSGVQTVISSGNVLFESDSNAIARLEALVEKALPERLSFNSTTIIRSHPQIQALVELDPFAGLTDGPTSRLNVTFLKHAPKTDLKFPHRPPGAEYELLALHERAIFSVIDVTTSKTPNLMAWLEKQFGKEMTTRTWKTVERILNRLDADSAQG